MSDRFVIIEVYADRLVAKGVPMVRARVHPLLVIIHWKDDGAWDEVSVDDVRRFDGSNVETLSPNPLFRHDNEAGQYVNFEHLEQEDVGATYRVEARRAKSKNRLEERFECMLLGFESGESKIVLKRC